MNPALLVKRRNRLRAQHLAARSVDGLVRNRGIEHSQRRFDHLAAIVDLGDDAVGAMRVKRGALPHPDLPRF